VWYAYERAFEGEKQGGLPHINDKSSGHVQMDYDLTKLSG